MVCVTKKFLKRQKLFLLNVSNRVFHVVTTLKPSLVDLWNFFKNSLNMILLSLQWVISMDMNGFVIPNKSDGILWLSSLWSLPFWDSLITLLMKLNG